MHTLMTLNTQRISKWGRFEGLKRATWAGDNYFRNYCSVVAKLRRRRVLLVLVSIVVGDKQGDKNRTGVANRNSIDSTLIYWFDQRGGVTISM